jgi:hypothetical protein
MSALPAQLPLVQTVPSDEPPATDAPRCRRTRRAFSCAGGGARENVSSASMARSGPLRGLRSPVGREHVGMR